MDVVAPFGEHHGLRDPPQRLRRGDEEPVVRPHQRPPPPPPQTPPPPLRTHPGVNDRDVDGVLGHVARSVLQYLGPGLDLEPRNLVRQVDDGDPGRYAQPHPLASADEVVAQPEVREKAYGPHGGSIKRATTRATRAPAIPARNTPSRMSC